MQYVPACVAVGPGKSILTEERAPEALRIATAPLTEKRITVYRVAEIIPDLKTGRVKFVISLFDLHQNATANRLIGDYLARTLGNCG